ncbi:hypothetical protein BjapCC829_36495 [Bradyrhizobium barranii]|uniref:AlpA family transcriptional regulator n=1 Tax=Bradyrhizobium barranii TaxID=2992140 RepID=A0ABY3QHJ8_9BRAD|nr:hypothetical protein [Bradyrhizobium japonicum]UFW85365.1 hypothetical protein BjapCC829_36495 [Bradyrhizobium japonicum]
MEDHPTDRTSPPTEAAELELWDRVTVQKFFGGSKPIHISTLYRGVHSGLYPKPVNVSENVVRWIGHECRAARQRMIAERGEPKPLPHRGRPRGSRRREAAAKAATLTNEPSCAHEG